MNRKLAVDELGRPDLNTFREQAKLPVEVVLDNVRSLSNVGAIFRNADAFLIQKVWLAGITPKPPHREIQKTALGASDSVAWEGHPDPVALCRQLKEEGAVLVSVEQTTESVALQDFQPTNSDRTVLVLGNEVMGVNEEIVALSDVCLEVPQYGTKHSLNVSVCAGVIFWEICSKLKRLR